MPNERNEDSNYIKNNQDQNALKAKKDSEEQHKNNYENFDVYENEEMADYFMDDIDEMSMCEGSR